MPEQNPAQQPQIQLKATDEVLKGAYSNVAQVIHNREQFQIDFMNMDLANPIGVLVARTILAPGHMKRLVAALQDNLRRYEQQFGEVHEADAPAGADRIGFRAS